ALNAVWMCFAHGSCLLYLSRKYFNIPIITKVTLNSNRQSPTENLGGMIGQAQVKWVQCCLYWWYPIWVNFVKKCTTMAVFFG
ncbi:hypothetical protein, partial [Limosilactobacillus fermentum]